MTPQQVAEPRRRTAGRPHRHLRAPDLAARPGLRPVAPRQLGHHLPAGRPRIRPPRDRRQRVSTDEQGFLDLLSEGDRIWSQETGMCGGCGNEDCHDGPCVEGLCRQCPTRIAEGWWCPPSCTGGHR